MVKEKLTLHVDPERYKVDMATGIFVIAKYEENFIAADISTLTTLSLVHWLRSRGGKNIWAENTVLTLLGHESMAEHVE